MPETERQEEAYGEGATESAQEDGGGQAEAERHRRPKSDGIIVQEGGGGQNL